MRVIRGVALTLIANTALAVPMTWTAAGVITSIDDEANLIPFSLALGDTYYYEYTFESSTPDASAIDGFGSYPGLLAAMFRSGASIFNLDLNGGSFNQSAVYVLNEPAYPADRYQVQAWGPGDSYVAELLLQTPNFGSGGPISSDALLLTPPNPADFSNSTFQINWYGPIDEEFNQSISWFQGIVTSLTVGPAPIDSVSVPEPSTLALLTLGLLGVGTMRLRRR